MNLVSAWEDGEDVHPPPGLLPAGAFDKSDSVWSGDGQAELVARHVLSLWHLQHTVHVDHTLRYRRRLKERKQKNKNYYSLKVL